MFIIISRGPNLEPMVAVVAELCALMCAWGRRGGEGTLIRSCAVKLTIKNAGFYHTGLFSDW